MSLFTFFADLRGATAQLRRIADSLERAIPVTTPAVDPSDLTVDYYDERREQLRALVEDLKRSGDLPPTAELPEEEDVRS